MKQITLRANSEEDVRTQLNDLEAKSFHTSLAFIFILDRSLSLTQPASYNWDSVSEYQNSILDLGAWSRKTISNFLYGKSTISNSDV